MKEATVTDNAVIRVANAVKTYQSGKVFVQAVRDISLEIKAGEFAALAGPSGSGKTTLLNLISGLDTPTSGKIFLAGHELSGMTGGELSDFRRDHIGFVFQSFNLLPVLTVRENIEYTLVLQHLAEAERAKRVAEILEAVGLSGMEKRFPAELSGGQQQRVAVARAMVSRPDIILADEPTANLDSHTAAELIDLMKGLNQKRGMTFVFSTHDRTMMEHAKRLIRLKDGQIESDTGRK